MKIRLSYIIFCAVLIVNIYWIVSSSVLPFIDLPFRLAESQIVKEYSNADFRFREYYLIPTYLKSNTFHTYFCSLEIFGDVETANKIYYTLYVVILPLSVLYLIRKINGNIFYSLLSILYLVNHNVHWGFTGYTMSVPVLFLTFGFYHEYFINKKNKYLTVIFLSWLLLFFLHFQSVLFAFLLFFVLCIFFCYRKLIAGLILSVPVLILMYHSYNADSESVSTISYLTNYYFTDFLASFLKRLRIFFILDNFFLFDSVKGILYSLFISLLIFISFIFSAIKLIKTRIKTEYNYIFVILCVTAGCYLLLPDNINGQNIIYERYSAIIFILMIVIISITVKFRREVPAYIIICVLCLSHSIVIVDYMLDFRAKTSDFTADIIPQIPGKTLAGIIYDNDFRGRKVYTHFPMFYTVRNDGITAGIVDYRFGIIKRKASKTDLPQYLEWNENGTDYNEYYKNVNYLLIKSNSPGEFINFKLINHSGQWYLFENIMPDIQSRLK